jgi:hypothetical protein
MNHGTNILGVAGGQAPRNSQINRDLVVTLKEQKYVTELIKHETAGGTTDIVKPKRHLKKASALTSGTARDSTKNLE